MLSNKAQLALMDIRDNILAAKRFTDGLSFDQFKQSDLHFYAVTRALEIVSEAARRLPASFRERHASRSWALETFYVTITRMSLKPSFGKRPIPTLYRCWPLSSPRSRLLTMSRDTVDARVSTDAQDLTRGRGN
jgi:hypothetical protein